MPSSSLTGPVAIPVTSFTPAPEFNIPFGAPQKPVQGGAAELWLLGDRLMNRLVYRRFPGIVGYSTWVVTHAIDVGTGGNHRAAVRWYELRLSPHSGPPWGNPTVYQQGTYDPASPTDSCGNASCWRWMSSAAMDGDGNIALGYSVSSSDIHPAIRATGRLASNPLGQMTQAEEPIEASTSSQTERGDWGDYTSMNVDPEDDCSLWYTNEYVTAIGHTNWHTRIAKLRFAGCGT